MFELLHIQFMCKFCRSFCTFFVSIVLSVLRFTDSDNSFGIFKLFLPLQEHLSLTPVFVGFMVLDRQFSVQCFVDHCFGGFFCPFYCVLRFTDSDYHFGIFKLFFVHIKPTKSIVDCTFSGFDAIFNWLWCLRGSILKHSF